MMNIPEPFQKLFNNHSTHLLQMNDVSKFHFANKDNQDFFTLIQKFYNNGKINLDDFKLRYPDMEVYWETLVALGATTGTRELTELAFENKGRKINMCTALKNLKQEGIQEGKQEGIREGKQEGILEGEIRSVIKAYREMNCTEEFIMEKLRKDYQLNDDKIRTYLLR